MSPGDIRDIRGPIAIPSPWVPLVVAAGALLALAIAYAAYRWLRARGGRTKTRSPGEIAIERIERARAAFAAGSSAAEFCAEVADAIRVYLEARFALHATQRTTEELLVELLAADVPEVARHRDVLEDFLSWCDLAKFARLAVSADLAYALADGARRLVEATAANRAESTAPERAPQAEARPSEVGT